jgi:hypothetical protein
MAPGTETVQSPTSLHNINDLMQRDCSKSAVGSSSEKKEKNAEVQMVRRKSIDWRRLTPQTLIQAEVDVHLSPLTERLS